MAFIDDSIVCSITYTHTPLTSVKSGTDNGMKGVKQIKVSFNPMVGCSHLAHFLRVGIPPTEVNSITALAHFLLSSP